MARRDILIIVFAKAPQAGRVKTRLAAAIGTAAAARLHARLLARTLATARAARCGAVELHGAPARHALLRAYARRAGIALKPQAGSDIGERMHRAFVRGLRRHARVILIGSDCPVLRAQDLRRAARLLRGCDAVLGPAEDGGYPLLGLSRVSGALFEGVAWSTDAVLGQTRARLAGLQWRWKELRQLWDVDRPQDLERLRHTRLVGRKP